MNELAFAVWLTAYYLEIASECEDTPECRAFFVKNQAWAIGEYPARFVMNNSVYSEHVADWLYQLWLAEQELDELLGEQWGPSGDDPYCEIADVAAED